MLVLKLIFNYKIFSTKLYAHEMFVSREFKTIFQGSRDESHETFIHRPSQEKNWYHFFQILLLFCVYIFV